MTTIAYRNGVIAADSQMTAGNMKAGKVWKITRHDASGALLGLAGDVADCVAYLNHFRRYGITKKYTFDLEGSMGLVAKADGTIYLATGTVIFPIEEEFYAIGSGETFAMAAMRAGVGAIKALRVACELDIYSGRPIRALTHEGEKACTE